MKRLIVLLLLATPALANQRGLSGPDLTKALNGTPTYLGTITATAGTPKDNSTTAVPFTTFKEGSNMLVCFDAAGFVIGLPVTDANAVSTKMVPVAASSCFYLGLLSVNSRRITVDAASGTVNVKVFQVM